MNAISIVVIVESVLLRRSSVFFRVCGFSFRLQSTAKWNTVSKCQILTWQPLNRVGLCLPAKNGINSGARRNTIGGAESSDDHVIRPEEMEEDGGRIGGVQVGQNLLHALLGPFEVTLGLASDFDALRKVRASAFQTTLGESLQFHEFSLFGVEVAGAVFHAG